jgi:hypothetical protein
MYAITYRCDPPAVEGEILPQLRSFFRRLHQVRRELGKTPYLNRLQRQRCLGNLLTLQEMEREFHAIEYREDFLELHRRLRRYLYLESADLARVLGSECVEKRSLFLLVG